MLKFFFSSYLKKWIHFFFCWCRAVLWLLHSAYSLARRGNPSAAIPGTISILQTWRVKELFLNEVIQAFFQRFCFLPQSIQAPIGRCMSSALGARPLPHFQKLPWSNPREWFNYATCTPWTRFDLVLSGISFESPPVLLQCIMLSVVPGSHRHPSASVIWTRVDGRCIIEV